MKKILLIGCVIVFLFVAGCMTIPSGAGTPRPTLTGTTPSQVPSVTAVSNPVLPMNATVTLGTTENPFTASIDSIEIDTPAEPGKQTITIYVAVKNTGTESVRLVWFSRLTDSNGNTYGGIGISHGGTGARSGLIYPNSTEVCAGLRCRSRYGFFTIIQRSDARRLLHGKKVRYRYGPAGTRLPHPVGY